MCHAVADVAEMRAEPNEVVKFSFQSGRRRPRWARDRPKFRAEDAARPRYLNRLAHRLSPIFS